MSPQKLRLFALIAAVLVVAAGYWASFHDVIVVLNGEALTLSTQALTVGGALDDMGIQLKADDQLEPGRFAILKNGTKIILNRATLYQFQVDGEQIVLRSSQRDPLVVLAEAAINLESRDRLSVDGRNHDPLQPFPFATQLKVTIARAQTYQLLDGDEQQSIISSASTVGELLAENGIALYAGDQVEPDLETMLENVRRIQIQRAKQIEIKIGDQLISVRSTAETVGQALADAGIALQGLDRSNPASDEPIPEAGRIKVFRVEERLEMNTSVIPFEVEWQPDPETEIDSRSVIQLGRNGVQATSVRITYENGKEVSREDEGQWVLSQPVNQISGYGTKIVVRTAVVNGVSIEYWRTLELFATSYSPCRLGTADGSCGYYTALKDELKKGIVGVYYDWWLYMAGQMVYVPNYGYGKISDVGAYPDGRPWIDLGYSDDDWITWGSYVPVYFLTPIPPVADIPYILP